MNFIQRALCEKDGTPSSTRINLLILLIFTLSLIGVATAAEPAGVLPEVPASLADLVKFLFGAGTAKVALSSGADLIAAIKGIPDAQKAENQAQ